MKDRSGAMMKGGMQTRRPFDPDDPDMRACHSSEKLADVPIMLTGAGALYECQSKGMTVFMLWTKQDKKALLELKFTFSKELKKRIAQLDS